MTFNNIFGQTASDTLYVQKYVDASNEWILLFQPQPLLTGTMGQKSI
jgi:hypothetical protein